MFRDHDPAVNTDNTKFIWHFLFWLQNKKPSNKIQPNMAESSNPAELKQLFDELFHQKNINLWKLIIK